MNVETVASGRLVFHENPATLYNLSAVSLAASLLRCKILEKCQIPVENYISVPIPNSVKKTISALVVEMTESWKTWQSIMIKDVLSDRKKTDNWPEEVVWMGDGSISYNRTAVMLLDDCRLSSVEKFTLACQYCLVDHIETLWMTLTPPQREDVRQMNSCHQILSYWYSVLSSPSPTISTSNNSIVRSITEMLINSEKEYNWFAIEHFMSISDQENRRYHETAIFQGKSPKFMIQVLVSMKDEQLNKILKTYSKNIFYALSRNSDYFEFTVQIWNRMSNVFDEVTLMEVLLHVDELPLVRGQMWNVWHPAPEKLKNIVAETWGHLFIETPLVLCMRDFFVYCKGVLEPENMDQLFCDIEYPLIVDILLRKNFEYRSQYWLKYWSILITFDFDVEEVHYYERIMKLCFANENDIEVFKRTVMLDFSIIENHFKYLFEFKNLKGVQDYLNFCSVDSKHTADCRKQIMTVFSDEMYELLLRWDSAEDWERFRRFVEGVFSAAELEEYIKSLLWSPFLQRMLCYGRVHGIQRLVEKYLINATNTLITERKQHFVECIRSSLTGEISWISPYKKEYLDEFLTWCFDNDETKTNAFKKSLPIDEIFNKRLQKALISVKDRVAGLIDQYSGFPRMHLHEDELLELFGNCNRLLAWYFDTKENVAEFKAAKIEKFFENEILVEVFNGEKHDESHEYVADVTLRWVFDGDEGNMKNFKSILNSRKI